MKILKLPAAKLTLSGNSSESFPRRSSGRPRRKRDRDPKAEVLHEASPTNRYVRGQSGIVSEFPSRDISLCPIVHALAVAWEFQWKYTAIRQGVRITRLA